ncbi:MAG: hypothetical protein VX730_07870 [Pseudomonadota bacterium]|nr:hypothetical protein [Pseudomonadota bacterium]
MSLLDTKLKGLIQQINDPRQNVLLQIYRDFHDLFHTAPGSTHNHQAWPGGYADHIAEGLRINDVTYDGMEQIRPLPFTKGSAAVTFFFHDIEKIFKFADPTDPRVAHWHTELQHVVPKYWEFIKKRIILELMKTYDFELTDNEWNALKYTHGEGDDYTNTHRVSCPLAAHVGNCDRASARLWPEEGQGLG